MGSTFRQLLASCLFILFGCCSMVAAWAQVQTRTVHAQIDSMASRNDTLFLYLNAGTDAGLKSGDMGTVVARYLPNFPDDNYLEMGFGKIIALNEKRALLQLQQQTKGLKRKILAKDLVQFRYRPGTAGSLFTEMAARAIIFANSANKPHYSLNHVIRMGSRFNEDSVLQIMIQELAETAAEIKPTLKADDALNKVLGSGPYKGRTVVEIMETAKPADLRAFLYFVQSYPGKYMGYTYKFNETFATWVLNLAPIGNHALYWKWQQLIPNAVALQSWYKQEATTIRTEKLTSLFFDEAVTFSKEEKLDSALLAIHQGLKIAQAINDTVGKSSLYQALAQYYQDKEQYQLAIATCDSITFYASLSKGIEHQLNGYFKKAYCQYKISAFTESKKNIYNAEKLLKNSQANLKRTDSLDFWRKRYEYEGWADYAAGNYEQALQLFYTANFYNQQLQTNTATKNIAYNNWYIGRIYNKQALYEKALLAFDSSYQFFQLTGDEFMMAYTINEIGKVYYNLSRYTQSKAMHLNAYETMIRLNKWDNAGYSMSMLGSNLEMENKIDSSIAAHNESIVLRRKAGNKEGLAFSWKTLGKLYERTGQKIQSLEAYDSAAFFYAAISDSAEQAQNLLNIGKVHENDKDFRKAQMYYERAAIVLQRLQSRNGYIDALIKLGSVTWNIDMDASQRYYATALQEAKAVGDRVNQLYSMVNLATLAGRRQQFDSAGIWMQLALPLALATKDPAMEAFCYENMAFLAEKRLKATEAFVYYRKASAIYDTLDKVRYLRTQNRMASLYQSNGKFDSSAFVNEKVIAQARQLGYSLEQGDALIALAFQFGLQARYKEALALCDSAEQLYANSGNANSQANVLATKAQQYMGMGQYEQTFRYYARADSIYTAEGNDWERSTVALNVGVAHTSQGDYRKSIASFKEALNMRPYKLLDESNIIAYGNIAECYLLLQQYDSALAILDTLYPIVSAAGFERIGSGLAINMAQCYIARGQPNLARPLLDQSLRIAQRIAMPDREAEALLYLAIANRSTAPDNALQQLQQATAITDKFHLNVLGWETWYELGEFYYLRNDFANAIAAYKKSVMLVDKNSANIYGGETARKTYQGSGKKPMLYTRLIAALSATGAAEEAWSFAQKTQQEAIKDLLGGLSADASNTEKAQALTQLLELQQKRSGLDQSIQKLKTEGSNNTQLQALIKTREILEREYLNYVTNLVKTYPDIDGYFSKNVNPEDFKDIKENIPDDVAIILYLLNGRQLLIFTATNKKIGVKEIALTADLDPMIEQYITSLSNPLLKASTHPLVLRSTIKKKLLPPANSQSFVQQSEALYQLLIAPIENDIKSYPILCIIPNGKLSNLPFQCIGKKASGDAVKYLVEDHQIFYTNKLTVFLKPGRKDKSLTSFAGFGNPDNSLASAGKEVEAIGQMLQSQNIYLQGFATEAKAKESLEQSKYIHFATHGVLDYTDFSSSYLKMAPSPNLPDDGELRIDEIKSLNISGCELVTLSACETAVNQEVKKGWYISPANAFLVSSVRSVVASLWAVDDEATNILMQEFYKNLPNSNKVEALRKAQAALSATPGFEHPFYWGAFVLYGDWR